MSYTLGQCGDMLSVGVAVEPKNPANLNKYLKISLDYKVTMTDVIIVVSDHDEEMETSSSASGRTTRSTMEDSNQNVKQNGSQYRPDTSTADFRFAPEGGNESETYENRSISGSRSNRPACHRNRAESQKSQLQLLESRSYIPLISGASLLTLKPCSYYRQKLNMEDPNYWFNASSLQKTAGQKVIKKINDQHRLLAQAEAAQQRKRTNSNFGSLLFSNPNDNDFDTFQRTLIPMKKKPTKLEPLHLTRKI